MKAKREATVAKAAVAIQGILLAPERKLVPLTWLTFFLMSKKFTSYKASVGQVAVAASVVSPVANLALCC